MDLIVNRVEELFMSETETKMSLVDHLGELRIRILISVGALVIFSIVSYIFASDIIDVLTSPVGKELVYLAPTEAFFAQIKVSVVVGFLLALPIIFFQTWRFAAPGLKDNERRYLLILAPLAYIFFLGGTSFGLFVVIPFGMRFFLSFTSANLEAMFSLNSYLSFIIRILLPFGLIFQLPLVTTILVNLGLISSEFLKSNRKIVIVSIFIFGALLTPPDIISQTMMSLPLILLYEGSIIIAKIIE